MDYQKALETGRVRAEQAAQAMQRWTGVKAIAVCAVKPAGGSDSRTIGDWQPVGRRNYKEIARDEGIYGRGNYHLLVVDESGTAKACSVERFALAKVLRLAERLALPMAVHGRG